MIIYRPHRSELLDALKEMKEFETEEQMKEHIVKEWEEAMKSLTNEKITEAPFTVDDIVISDEVVNDERCRWHDTRYVCIKRIGTDIFDTPQCIGMCSTEYEKGYIPFSQ